MSDIDSQKRPCPKCGQPIWTASIVCVHCKADLDESSVNVKKIWKWVGITIILIVVIWGFIMSQFLGYFLLTLTVIGFMGSKAAPSLTSTSAPAKNIKQEVGSYYAFDFGKYLYGLSSQNNEISTTCYDKEKEFIFYSRNTSLGSIKKANIKRLAVEDRSTIERRITATRLLTIGVFALAFKKKKEHPSFYLTIEFLDGPIESQAIFEFQSMSAANAASQKIKNCLK
ncbi:MAG: hypothetical protein ACM3SY_16645 [Candidatus Omnitrophota bacterium]